MESQIIRPGQLTAHQTAAALGIGLPAVRKLVERGELKRAPGSTPRQPWYALVDVQAYEARRAARVVA